MQAGKTAHTWILLRGLARETAHWGPFLERFQKAFPGDEVLAIDLPGAGEFVDRPAPLTMTEVFNFVRGQAIERARLQGQFRLVALSLGGMVAMEWMRHRPADLSGCILINTSLKGLSPFYKRLRWQVWRELLKILTIQHARERESAIIDLIINRPEAKAEALPLWAKIALERPVTYKNFAAQLACAARFEGFNEDVTVPVLLLNSLGDHFVDPSCSTVLHERWGWPIHRHPWAGHDLPWDDPDWVLEKIQLWNHDIDTLSQ